MTVCFRANKDTTLYAVCIDCALFVEVSAFSFSLFSSHYLKYDFLSFDQVYRKDVYSYESLFYSLIHTKLSSLKPEDEYLFVQTVMCFYGHYADKILV